MKIGSLFTGYGGLDQAVSSVTGAETVWVSDVDKGANKILAHRYPGIPNLGDITQVDFTTVEPIDILTGGFPCQDLSHAGKRAGLKEGTRSGLWSHMARAIKELQPKLVVVENVRGLLSADAPGDVEPCPWCVGDGSTVNLRALGVVLADLAGLGFDAEWVGLRCADVGGCHSRFRVFLIAYPNSGGGDQTIEHDGGRKTFGDGASVLDERHSFVGGAGSVRTLERLLPTPGITSMKATSDSSQKHQVRTRHSPGLDSVGALLMSPVSRDGKDVGDLSTYELPTLPRQIQTQSGGVTEPLTDWGIYKDAIRVWETVTGREVPPPTQKGARGEQMMLSAVFVEWMMGLPEGWVTGVPGLSRNEALKALGNGVVPQQASAALTHLLGRLS